MITPIPFEARRFQGAAVHYLGGRPDYAPALAPLVAQACSLDGTGRLLDLGCGPGQLARAFLPFMASGLGLDPEPEMVALGRSLSDGGRLEFLEGSSGDLGPEFGRFRLVTIGRAFHWMDRVETLRRLDGLLEPGGAVVLFRVDHLDVPENAWHAPYQALQDEAFRGGGRAAWRQPGWVKHESVLLGSAFPALVRIGVVERVRTPAAALLGRALSMSGASRARLGPEGVAALRDAIDAVLAPFTEAGAVTEVLESVALIARRA